MCYTKPNFYYINIEIRPQKVKYGTNLDSNVRYFCQEKDYRSLIYGEFGLVPKIVRYWSFVIDYYCVQYELLSQTFHMLMYRIAPGNVTYTIDIGLVLLTMLFIKHRTRTAKSVSSKYFTYKFYHSKCKEPFSRKQDELVATICLQIFLFLLKNNNTFKSSL